MRKWDWMAWLDKRLGSWPALCGRHCEPAMVVEDLCQAADKVVQEGRASASAGCRSASGGGHPTVSWKGPAATW